MPRCARCRIRWWGGATRWISKRSKRPSRRARASCCIRPPPIRWAGWPRTRNSRACSTSRGATVMVVHSFSKTYCMTGWRVGWLVARRDLAEKATQLNEFIVSHAPTFAQRAAETALAEGEGELRRMLERLKENRDLCLDALRGLPGVTVPKPDGAFYLFPRVAGLTDSFAFCRKLLEETRVGLAPGVAFGAGGEGSFRICYAAERSILELAMERLTKFLRSYA